MFQVPKGLLLFQVYREAEALTLSHVGTRLAHDADEACHMLGVPGPSDGRAHEPYVVIAHDPAVLVQDDREPNRSNES